MNFALFLEMHARGRGDALAVADRRLRLSYGELNQAANRFANILTTAGLGHEDRVAFYMPNRVELAICLMGAFKAGVIAVPINWRLQSGDLTKVLAHCRPAMIVSTEEHARNLPDRRTCRWLCVNDRVRGGSFWTEIDDAGSVFKSVGRQNEDIANLLYTSGTTALPKAAIHTHGMRLAIAATMADCFELSCTDMALAVSPMFHTGGFSVFANAIFSGSAVYLLEKWDLVDFISVLKTERITFMHLVTTVIVDIARAPPEMFSEVEPRLRFTWGGGHSVEPEVFLEFEKRLGGVFLQGYSRTEGGITYNPLDRGRRRFDSHGYPNRNNSEVAVVDPATGLPCAPGMTGEIVVHGDGVSPGYWDDRFLTVPRRYGGIWQPTGDIGTIDEDGALLFLGRQDHLIKTGGENVYPDEVSSVIRGLPDVSDAIVFDMPDDRLGQIVAALVVAATPGLSADRIQSACREVLAGFKIPRQLAIVDSLPRLGSGKVDLAACRKVLQRHHGSPDP